MTDLVIYGASDDLIEVRGAIEDELNPPYGKPVVVTVKVDDTVHVQVRAEYSPDGTGEWRLAPVRYFGGTPTISRARGEGKPDDSFGCPGHSDLARVFLGGIESRRVNVSLEAVTEHD